MRDIFRKAHRYHAGRGRIQSRFLCPLGFFAIALVSSAAASRLHAEGSAPAAAAHAAQAPSAQARDQEIERLIEQMGSPDYFVRQHAEAQLLRFGREAFDALSTATANSDLEIASRSRRLLLLIHITWTESGDPIEVRRLLSDYESLNLEGRQERMTKLALLPNDAGVAALCRLMRYEQSSVLSKSAAVKLLATRKDASLPGKSTTSTIENGLHGSPRPAAVWVLGWLRSAEDPSVMAGTWTKWADNEQSILMSTPSQSSPEIVGELLRFQVESLKRLGRPKDAIVAVERLFQLEQGDPDSLFHLLQWLVDQKDWNEVDELAERCPAQIAEYPILLYLVAEAQAGRGEVAKSEKTAEQAFKFHPVSQPLDDVGRRSLIQHLLVATQLMTRGRFDWAKREYRYTIGSGVPATEIAVRAEYGLSEMLHDLAEEKDAADVLSHEVEAIGAANKPAETAVGTRTLGEVLARMNFFYACHWLAKGDLAKQREYLEKALTADATDVDVLIACYRVQDAKPDYHKRILKLIEKSASDLRERIADQPDESSNYNQFAWLIANTEGNQDEALSYSKKSVELAPDAGGYFDTLARVYYAKHDYAGAVKYQTKAIELDPHSMLIAKQLAFFKQALKDHPSAKIDP